MRLVNIRNDFLTYLEDVIGDEAGWGLWKSGYYRSFLIMFDPDKIVLPNSISEDWKELAWKLEVLQKILDSDPSFYRCPSDKLYTLRKSIENLKEEAMRKGRMTEDDFVAKEAGE